ncbi:hypothetical protein HYT04_00075 [Candidatus Kaiserbacteria bacterium]|nr:hypothetical protein [Candidatus Kaiserbacteria bacterium]
MLTKDDKKFLTENFGTKKEVGAIRDGLDILRNKLTMSSLEKFDFKSEVEAMRASDIRTEEKIDKLITIMDGYAGKIAELDQENKMGARTLHRHGVQIQELAKATGTALSE